MPIPTIKDVMAPTYVLPSGMVEKSINDQMTIIIDTINQIINAIANFPNPTVIKSALTAMGVSIPNPPVIGVLGPSPETIQQMSDLKEKIASEQAKLDSLMTQANQLQGTLSSTISSATSAVASATSTVSGVTNSVPGLSSVMSSIPKIGGLT